MRWIELCLLVVLLCSARDGSASQRRGLIDPYSDAWLYSHPNTPLLQNARTLWEAAHGKPHPNLDNTLLSIASRKGMFQWNGPLYRAESLHLSIIALREASLGEDDPALISSLRALANLYTWRGLYDKAKPLYLRALNAERSALARGGRPVSLTLSALANFYKKQGLYDQAEALSMRVRGLQEAAFGLNSAQAAWAGAVLADVYRQRGLYAKAIPLYLRAISAEEQPSFAARDPMRPAPRASPSTLAELFEGLATSYFALGWYDQADAPALRALALRTSSFKEIDALNRLATLRLAQHRQEEALPLYARAFSMSEQYLREVALDTPDVGLSSFLPRVRAHEETMYALLRAHSGDPRVQRLALGAVLLRKGRSGEESANLFQTLHRKLDGSDWDMLRQLREVRAQRAALSLEGPGPLHPFDYQLSIIALEDADDALESALIKRAVSRRARLSPPPVDEVVSRVAAAIPRDGALVEFIAYSDRPLIPRTGRQEDAATSPSEPLRYLALVLFPDSSTRAVDLGAAEPIDQAVARLNQDLSSRAGTVLASAQELHRLAFRPLLPLLGSTRRLLVSPDGQLGLVPFAALHDGHEFLVDTFDITYLTSGRELLAQARPRTPATSVVVLADPDFSVESRGLPSTYRSAALERFFASNTALARGEWAPLPGTRLEAQGIRSVLPQARLFLGANATKERLLGLSSPGILHVATHGFFLGSAPTPGSRGRDTFASGGPPPPQQEPLLNSGLVLAGIRSSRTLATANPSEGALVTALELSGLNLWGTQLVVLSACDTGRGEVSLGQGIYGLRRALVVAGAETVVMSLWKVNDDSTRLLMDAYYRNLRAGLGRATALREAMRSFKATHPHPYHWAPFIALGRDAPLYGIIPPVRQKPKPSPAAPAP